MRAILGCTLAALLGLGTGLSADDKKPDPIDEKKLVGKWEPKEKKEGATFVIEFSKDGKTTFTTTAEGKESKTEGSYKVDGNKLTVTYKVGDKEQTRNLTVTKQTDSETTVADEKGKEVVLMRLKNK